MAHEPPSTHASSWIMGEGGVWQLVALWAYNDTTAK